MFQSENELKALAEAGASRLKHFLPVILGVFAKGVPSKVKLWDIKPMIPDDLKPTQREPKLYRQLDILAEHFKAKEEQLQAIIRSYNASAGLSLVHGGPRTGKSTTALLQAMIAVSMGHKVILCAPVGMYDDLESLFRRLWSGMPEGGAPNVYIARNPASEDYRTKWCELAIASNDPNCSMPITLGHGVWKALHEDIRKFNSPETQALYKDHQNYHPALQQLVESQLLQDLIPTMQSEDDTNRFLHLYNKIYFRVIAGADVIITSCHNAGVEDLYSNFRPTVAIVDDYNLAAEPEAWIPLLMYKDIRFRILLGDRAKLRPHTMPADDPWAAQRQLSLLERWALTEVPVYDLKTQFPSLEINLQHKENSDENGGRGMLARNEPCLCGSRRKYKKCCGTDEKSKAGDA